MERKFSIGGSSSVGVCWAFAVLVMLSALPGCGSTCEGCGGLDTDMPPEWHLDPPEDSSFILTSHSATVQANLATDQDAAQVALDKATASARIELADTLASVVEGALQGRTFPQAVRLREMLSREGILDSVRSVVETRRSEGRCATTRCIGLEGRKENLGLEGGNENDETLGAGLSNVLRKITPKVQRNITPVEEEVYLRDEGALRAFVLLELPLELVVQTLSTP